MLKLGVRSARRRLARRPPQTKPFGLRPAAQLTRLGLWRRSSRRSCSRPVGTESCVSANQIETKISRRNSTTHTDNTATDADTHDHTPTDDTAAATELGRPPPTETPPLPPETPPALPQPPPEEAAATPHRPPPAPVTATHGGGGGADPPPTPDIHTPALRPAARRDPPMSPTAAGSAPPPPAKPHRAAPRRLWGD